MSLEHILSFMRIRTKMRSCQTSVFESVTQTSSFDVYTGSEEEDGQQGVPDGKQVPVPVSSGDVTPGLIPVLGHDPRIPSRDVSARDSVLDGDLCRSLGLSRRRRSLPPRLLWSVLH